MPPKASTSSSKNKNSAFEPQTSLDDYFQKFRSKQQSKPKPKKARHSTGSLPNENPTSINTRSRVLRPKRKIDVIDLTADTQIVAEPFGGASGAKRLRLDDDDEDVPVAQKDNGKEKNPWIDEEPEILEFQTPRERARPLDPPTSVTLVPMSCLTTRSDAATSTSKSTPAIRSLFPATRKDPFFTFSSFTPLSQFWDDNDDAVIPSSQDEICSSPNVTSSAVNLKSRDKPSYSLSYPFSLPDEGGDDEVIPDSQVLSPEKPKRRPKSPSPTPGSSHSMSSPFSRVDFLAVDSQSEHRVRRASASSCTQPEDLHEVVPSSWSAALLTMPSNTSNPFLGTTTSSRAASSGGVKSDQTSNGVSNFDDDMEIIPSSQSQLLSPPPHGSSFYASPRRPPIAKNRDKLDPPIATSPGPRETTPSRKGPLTSGPRMHFSPSKAIVYISPSKASSPAKIPSLQSQLSRVPSVKDQSRSSSSMTNSTSSSSSFRRPPSLYSQTQTQDEPYAPWMLELLAKRDRQRAEGVGQRQTQTSDLSQTQDEPFEPWMEELLRKRELARAESAARRSISKEKGLFLGSPLDDDEEQPHSADEQGDDDPDKTVVAHGKRLSLLMPPPPAPPARPSIGGHTEDSSTATARTPAKPSIPSPEPPSSPPLLMPELMSRLDLFPREGEVSIDDMPSQFSVLSEGPDFAPLDEELFRALNFGESQFSQSLPHP